MATIAIKAETAAFVVDTLKAEAGVQKRWVKAADLLRADGVTSDLLNKDEDFRKTFKTNVVLLSFTATEQKIMAKPVTSCSDEEKVTRRWIQNQMGSRLSRVAQYVKKAEDEEKMTDEDRGARRVADMATRLKKDLTAWIEKVEKAEAVTFSATEMVKYLKSASALIK